MAGEGVDEQRQQDAQEGDGAGMLLLAQIAEAVEARHLEHLGKGKKRKDADTESQDAAASEKNGTQNVDASKRTKLEEHTVEAELFAFLTPSDLRLTAQALVDTKVSHFKCNVNGCQKDYRAFLAPSDLFVCEERMGWCCQRATSPHAGASKSDEEEGTYVCGFKECSRKVASLAELALHRKVAHPDWPADASWVGSYNLGEGDLQGLQAFRVLCSRYSEGCKESFTSIQHLRAHVLNKHKDPACPCPHEHSHTH